MNQETMSWPTAIALHCRVASHARCKCATSPSLVVLERSNPSPAPYPLHSPPPSRYLSLCTHPPWPSRAAAAVAPSHVLAGHAELASSSAATPPARRSSSTTAPAFPPPPQLVVVKPSSRLHLCMWPSELRPPRAESSFPLGAHDSPGPSPPPHRRRRASSGRQ